MKTYLFSLALVAGLATTVTAQTGDGLKFGIKAGVTFPTISVSGETLGLEPKSNTSFYFGGTVEIPLSTTFSIQPGLSLIGKGFKIKDSEVYDANNSYSTEAKASTYYIELPVNAIANFNVGTGKIFIGAGPYYALAVSGKAKGDVTIKFAGVTETESIDEDIEFGSDEDQMKRSDFGVNFLAGYQLNNGFNIHAGYGLGLSNYSNASDSKEKNRVFSVGVGFSF